nr:MAG TPA: hypothetical protein [Bacteriophage sp.]
MSYDNLRFNPLYKRKDTGIFYSINISVLMCLSYN